MSIPDDLVLPFLFVPHGEPEGPEVAEFKTRYPEWFSIPGWFIPHPDRDAEPIDAAPGVEEPLASTKYEHSNIRPESLTDQEAGPQEHGGFSAAPRDNPRSVPRGLNPPSRPGAAIEAEAAMWRTFQRTWAVLDNPIPTLLSSFLTRDFLQTRKQNASLETNDDCGTFGEVSDPSPNRLSGKDTRPFKLAAGTNKKLGPDPDAIGPHSTFRRALDGTIQHYETYETNPSTGRYAPVLRYRGRGKPHDDVKPPFVLERETGKGLGSQPKVSRPALPSEIPTVKPIAPDLPLEIPEILVP